LLIWQVELFSISRVYRVKQSMPGHILPLVFTSWRCNNLVRNWRRKFSSYDFNNVICPNIIEMERVYFNDVNVTFVKSKTTPWPKVNSLKSRPRPRLQAWMNLSLQSPMNINARTAR